jgi:protein-S-isoprenylcysteine O-methyltransferase Ste14
VTQEAVVLTVTACIFAVGVLFGWSYRLNATKWHETASTLCTAAGGLALGYWAWLVWLQ